MHVYIHINSCITWCVNWEQAVILIHIVKSHIKIYMYSNESRSLRDWIFAFHKMATLTHLAAFYSALVSQAAGA